MQKSTIIFYAYKITVKSLFSGISTEPQGCLDICPRFLENFTISRAALSKLVKYFSKSGANISTTLWLCLDPRKKKFHCDFLRVEEDDTFSHDSGYFETVCLSITIATLCMITVYPKHRPKIDYL